MRFIHILQGYRAAPAWILEGERAEERDAPVDPVGLRFVGRNVHVDDKIRRVPGGRQGSCPSEGLVHRTSVDTLRGGASALLLWFEPDEGHVREELFGAALRDGVLLVAPASPLEGSAATIISAVPLRDLRDKDKCTNIKL